ncbi:hypothetical protein [Xenorhabdus hominickii]|uniref:Methylmalonate-semialdehyde dehydrogenase n=1 Tax=Xenorhabdus hominickii TaxID=351679 RepID=A0A2G0Q528_XENHO|nr:hypothetical protein [Xenorhabdus hominickii]AOM40049.1 hypothetical protein A9255_05350 [Xenorhabdus hominickii]PHM51686.1 methylmalonate-semialdehyde dehydrogenase [Xenorhabdus hominickii]PHM54319.1 methylmalonate-semialdehyde dehydrogenase [Xenorhabdus hominickii]
MPDADLNNAASALMGADYGPDGVRFYTRRKTITQHWIKHENNEAAKFAFPSNQLISLTYSKSGNFTAHTCKISHSLNL